jgi:hypothetical protein
MDGAAEDLGDVVQILVNPFDKGKRAMIVFEVKKPNNINGNTTKYAGAILEEKQLLQLVDGLAHLAIMREAATATQRIIAPTFIR